MKKKKNFYCCAAHVKTVRGRSQHTQHWSIVKVLFLVLVSGLSSIYQIILEGTQGHVRYVSSGLINKRRPSERAHMYLFVIRLRVVCTTWKFVLFFFHFFFWKKRKSKDNRGTSLCRGNRRLENNSITVLSTCKDNYATGSLQYWGCS